MRLRNLLPAICLACALCTFAMYTNSDAAFDGKNMQNVVEIQQLTPAQTVLAEISFDACAIPIDLAMGTNTGTADIALIEQAVSGDVPKGNTEVKKATTNTGHMKKIDKFVITTVTDSGGVNNKGNTKTQAAALTDSSLALAPNSGQDANMVNVFQNTGTNLKIMSAPDIGESAKTAMATINTPNANVDFVYIGNRTNVVQMNGNQMCAEGNGPLYALVA